MPERHDAGRGRRASPARAYFEASPREQVVTETQASVFRALAGRPVSLPRDTAPLLLVTVDAEAEFNWGDAFSRRATGASSMAAQHRAQEILDRDGVVPTYLLDQAVATDEAAIRILKDLLAQGRCELGAHLNPWITPPFEESVTVGNSYAGNLSHELERRKLACLTDSIAARFGSRPRVYRAGRYGIGRNSPAILEELGYEVDLSVVARTRFTGDGGPDFTSFDPTPFIFGRRRRLLEVPVTAGFTGLLARLGPSLYPRLAGQRATAFRLPGLSARLGLLERIRLTPEGIDYAALRRLTEHLVRQGYRIFSLTYHSPSLVPGNTPYVRDEADLRVFLGTLENYLDYFLGRLGGRPTTPLALYRMLAHARDEEASPGAASETGGSRDAASHRGGSGNAG